jgi:hypothetical protein
MSREPKPAHWILRLWGIRHVRAILITYRINRHYEEWSKLGALPVYADRDWAIVDRIRAGEL